MRLIWIGSAFLCVLMLASKVGAEEPGEVSVVFSVASQEIIQNDPIVGYLRIETPPGREASRPTILRDITLVVTDMGTRKEQRYSLYDKGSNGRWRMKVPAGVKTDVVFVCVGMVSDGKIRLASSVPGEFEMHAVLEFAGKGALETERRQLSIQSAEEQELWTSVEAVRSLSGEEFQKLIYWLSSGFGKGWDSRLRTLSSENLLDALKSLAVRKDLIGAVAGSVLAKHSFLKLVRDAEQKNSWGVELRQDPSYGAVLELAGEFPGKGYEILDNEMCIVKGHVYLMAKQWEKGFSLLEEVLERRLDNYTTDVAQSMNIGWKRMRSKEPQKE